MIGRPVAGEAGKKEHAEDEFRDPEQRQALQREGEGVMVLEQEDDGAAQGQGQDVASDEAVAKGGIEQVEDDDAAEKPLADEVVGRDDGGQEAVETDERQGEGEGLRSAEN